MGKDHSDSRGQLSMQKHILPGGRVRKTICNICRQLAKKSRKMTAAMRYLRFQASHDFQVVRWKLERARLQSKISPRSHTKDKSEVDVYQSALCVQQDLYTAFVNRRRRTADGVMFKSSYLCKNLKAKPETLFASLCV